ncbi:hypothetical protein EUX98_g6809 [Antrodiella citrinella]|uniref:Uncharacterized protein n=1 Tax=Antrodiella citrinella TaxID=2447956 RepID=A0A4S4MN26_9APHY|nr:hypothetical protein EUX98_g6809 [Antrodiella citrinella]
MKDPDCVQNAFLSHIQKCVRLDEVKCTLKYKVLEVCFVKACIHVGYAADPKRTAARRNEWLSKVEAHSANATEHDFDTVPAIKLLRFFRAIEVVSIANLEVPLTGGRTMYDKIKAQKISSALNTAKMLDAGSVSLWLRY